MRPRPVPLEQIDPRLAEGLNLRAIGPELGRSYGRYADIGINRIMPGAGLCRMAVVVICASTVEVHAGSA